MSLVKFFSNDFIGVRPPALPEVAGEGVSHPCFAEQIITMHCYNNACGIRYAASAICLGRLSLVLVVTLISPD